MNVNREIFFGIIRNPNQTVYVLSQRIYLNAYNENSGEKKKNKEFVNKYIKYKKGSKKLSKTLNSIYDSLTDHDKEIVSESN